MRDTARASALRGTCKARLAQERHVAAGRPLDQLVHGLERGPRIEAALGLLLIRRPRGVLIQVRRVVAVANADQYLGNEAPTHLSQVVSALRVVLEAVALLTLCLLQDVEPERSTERERIRLWVPEGIVFVFTHVGPEFLVAERPEPVRRRDALPGRQRELAPANQVAVGEHRNAVARHVGRQHRQRVDQLGVDAIARLGLGVEHLQHALVLAVGSWSVRHVLLAEEQVPIDFPTWEQLAETAEVGAPIAHVRKHGNAMKTLLTIAAERPLLRTTHGLLPRAERITRTNHRVSEAERRDRELHWHVRSLEFRFVELELRLAVRPPFNTLSAVDLPTMRGK